MPNWKKFASAFVEFDETKESTPKVAPTIPQPSPQLGTLSSIKKYDDSITTSSRSSTNAPVIQPASEIKQHFYDVIKQNNFPGPDFFEFNEMLKAMASIPVESTKYIAAFSGLSVQGMTKDNLISSAQKYKDIISKSLDEFQGAYEQMVQTQVTDKKTQIEQETKEMESISKRISELSDSIKKLNDEAQTAESTLKLKKDAFINGGNNVLSEIDEEIGKINSYIN